MPLFSKSKVAKVAWHRQLHKSNIGAQFESGELWEFPMSQVELTREYLALRTKRSNGDDTDKLLRELIYEHVANNGNREVATLACLPEFSRLSAIAALVQSRGDNQNDGASRTAYLRLLILAHNLQPACVSPLESEVAIALLDIHQGQADPLLTFRNMISILAKISTSNVLPASYINSLLHFCQIPKSYNVFIGTLRRKSHLATLYRAMAWIKNIEANRRQYGLAYEVIEAQVPELRLWLSWPPDEAMLQRWESYAFKEEHMAKLCPIFLLEGPDTTGNGHRTFKEAGPACWDTINMQSPSLHRIQCLYALLQQAMAYGDEAVGVICQLCLTAQTTQESIELAEKVIALRDDNGYRASCQIVKHLKQAVNPVTQMRTLPSMLSALQQYPDMRAIFGAPVMELVVPPMQPVQELYRSNVKRNGKDSVGNAILSYGRASERATWLHDSVAWPEGFLDMLHRMPSTKAFEDVMQQFDRPHSERADALLKEYLAATIGGAGSREEIDALWNAIEFEKEFYLLHEEVERNHMLAAIKKKKLDYDVTDISFLRACREQILKEDLALIRELLHPVESGTYMSCIDMLRILARRINIPMPVNKVWLSLTLFMMGSCKTSFIDWACDNLPVEQWFEFVTDVMSVFGEQKQQGGQADSLANMGMTPERFLWWKRLLDDDTRYCAGVAKLERQLRRKTKTGSVRSMKWLYLQEVPHVDSLLDIIVGRKNLGYQSQWLLDLYEPTVASLTTLCNCIAAHSQVSDLALQGIHLVLERCRMDESWPNSALEVYLLAWTKSEQLTVDDVKAFDLLSELMGIRPAMNPRGLEFIKNKTLKQYDELIALARQAETMRVQVRRST